jgi:hypothetical protein
MESKRLLRRRDRRAGSPLALATVLVGGLQVLVLAHVLPAELALLPDVGEALASLGGLHAFLERVPLALGVDLGRLGLVEQLAEIEEVLLAGAPFGEEGEIARRRAPADRC